MPDAPSRFDPGPILQTAFAFWSSKVLLTAVGFGLFTRLGDGRMTAPELGEALELHERWIYDFFDALVAMGFLERDGDGPSAVYANTPAGALYLDSTSPRYVGGWLVMLNQRLLPPVEPIARKHIASAGLSDRIETAAGDFFQDPLPKADVITMGMILHDWNLEKKMHLIRSAYDSLLPGGALVAIEALIDDARRENLWREADRGQQAVKKWQPNRGL